MKHPVIADRWLRRLLAVLLLGCTAGAGAQECPVEPNQCYFSNHVFAYEGDTTISSALPVGSVLGTLNLSLDYSCRLQEYLSGDAGRYIVLGIATEGSHLQARDFATQLDGLIYRALPEGDPDGVGVKQIGGVANRIQLTIAGDRTPGPSECVDGSMSTTFAELIKNGNIEVPGSYLVNFRNPAFFVGARWNNTPPSYDIAPFPPVSITFLPTTCELSEAPSRVDFGTFAATDLPVRKSFDFHWTCDGGTTVETTLSATTGQLVDGDTAILHDDSALLLKIRDLANNQYVHFNQAVEHVIDNQQALGFSISFQAELLDAGAAKPGPFEFVVLYNTVYK